MPFRGFEGQRDPSFDPLARFFELDAALEADRGLFGDTVPMRLLAADLVLCPGDPASMSQAIQAGAGALRMRLPILSQTDWSLQVMLVAVLLRRGDQVEAFVTEVERVRPILRRLGLRRAEAYELIAIATLRIANALAPIPEPQLARLAAIYAAMKQHHYFLTGPEDYPALAFLTAYSSASPEQLGERAHAIYEGLHEHAKLLRGDPLQTASHLLASSELDPDELVERYGLVLRAIERNGLEIDETCYDALAILCFLPQPVEAIAATVAGYATVMGERSSWTSRQTVFGFAANLAFVRLTAHEPTLAALADVECLLDMQSVIVYRRWTYGLFR
jgi:hypothetical protein